MPFPPCHPALHSAPAESDFNKWKLQPRGNTSHNPATKVAAAVVIKLICIYGPKTTRPTGLRHRRWEDASTVSRFPAPSAASPQPASIFHGFAWAMSRNRNVLMPDCPAGEVANPAPTWQQVTMPAIIHLAKCHCWPLLLLLW